MSASVLALCMVDDICHVIVEELQLDIHCEIKSICRFTACIKAYDIAVDRKYM